MTDLEKAARMALSTLEGWAGHGTWVWPESALQQAKRNTTEAITALRQALSNSVEQPAQQQEPVADVNVRPSPHGGCGIASVFWHKLPVGSWLLYTSPPASKPWVGLTWDDMPDSSCGDPAFLAGAQWANSKLKEKNA